MKRKKILYRTVSVLVTLAVIVLTVFLFLAGLAGGIKGVLPTLKYAAGLGVIQKYYVGDYDLNDVTDAALAGVVEALDDRWSYYMDEEAYAAYRQLSENSYQGIGVTISPHEETGGFLIHAVTKDGPAQLAGISEGDIILAVDGKDITGFTTEELRALIQADFGGYALVTVLHPDGMEEEYSVSCEAVYTTPVQWEMMENNIGYVRIANFRTGAGEDTIAAVEELVALGAEGIVFDVRSNPGGLVDEMVEALDYLLPEGDVFIRANRRGVETAQTSDAEWADIPAAVIVNADSYSAAEYFAAVLQEYGRASVVGEATTGKGRSQVTVSLWDGSAIHLSRYTYLTPAGLDLSETGGLVPDAVIGLTEEQRLDFDTGWLESAEDPQIRAAVAALES